MKKFLAIVLTLCLVLSVASVAFAAGFVPGTYEGAATGMSSTVKVTLTVDENGITDAVVDASGETPTIGGAAAPTYQAALIGRADAEIDVVAGATLTHDAVVAAANQALEAASAGAAAEEALAFTAGDYEATFEGYNGPVTIKASFSDSALTAIDVVASGETDHVGTLAYDIMIPEMLECNGAGVDSVSGATFTGRALRSAVIDCAEQAGCTNLTAFSTAKIEHAAGDAIDLTYDVVVVGAGGAGISAAAQAAQLGNTVLVIEKNAEMGGNTLVSGGQYQSVMPYLVWDPADPDATTGVYEHDGQTYDKVKSANGCINELKIILNWNEEPFDADFYKDHEFVAGDTAELAKHGVHQEYLPVLKELKQEIQAYLDWAQPQLDAGLDETKLTLFSTLNLHIFQSYYGGLRQSADGSEWCYGDIELVKQFIEGGQGLKEWLEAQGSLFIENTQPTLIGALWYRENEFIGAVIDGETVYSEEVVWHPKTSEDPNYQFEGIVAAFKTAASKMPRVDGIGVSSAGVFIGNAPMVSSLFIKVPESRREEVKTIYDRAAKELGENLPIVVANDGDVTALAGSMSLGAGNVMGLAMGTSEAVGYVNGDRNILGWFNELAFAPVDLSEYAMRDEWSGDIGVGCKYFSQDAVIKLASAAGITLSENLTPAEKLKEVQTLAESGLEYAKDIFVSIGCYLAHALALYSRFYDLRYLLVLGRTASGVGGELIVSECKRVLADEYPTLSEKITVMLPDEKFRRVGQSMAAASLPEV